MSRRSLTAAALLLAAGAASAEAQFTVGSNATTRSGTGLGTAYTLVANADGAAAARTSWLAGTAFAQGTIDLGSGTGASCAAPAPTGLFGYVSGTCIMTPGGIAVGNGVTMSLERVAPQTPNWGPIVAKEGFTYRDPNQVGSGPDRIDVAQGHYAVNAAGVQQRDAHYVRMTSLPNANANPAGTTVGALTFSQAIQGFGFYLVDTNLPASSLTIRYLLSGETQFTCVLQAGSVCGESRAAITDGGVTFVGLNGGDRSFDRIEFATTNVAGGSIDGWSLSNAQAIVTPEPSTYALMATGLAALGALRRRRRTV